MSAGEIDLGAEMAREPRPRFATRAAVHHGVRVRLVPEAHAQAIARDIERTVRDLVAHLGEGRP